MQGLPDSPPASAARRIGLPPRFCARSLHDRVPRHPPLAPRLLLRLSRGRLARSRVGGSLLLHLCGALLLLRSMLLLHNLLLLLADHVDLGHRCGPRVRGDGASGTAESRRIGDGLRGMLNAMPCGTRQVRTKGSPPRPRCIAWQAPESQLAACASQGDFNCPSLNPGRARTKPTLALPIPVAHSPGAFPLGHLILSTHGGSVAADSSPAPVRQQLLPAARPRRCRCRRSGAACSRTRSPRQRPPPAALPGHRLPPVAADSHGAGSRGGAAAPAPAEREGGGGGRRAAGSGLAACLFFLPIPGGAEVCCRGERG